jgi:hypothetical protein
MNLLIFFVRNFAISCPFSLYSLHIFGKRLKNLQARSVHYQLLNAIDCRLP